MDDQETQLRSLALKHDRTLVVEHLPGLDILRVLGGDGRACLSVILTATGPMLQFEGSLMLQASGDLAVSAGKVAIHGRDGVAITTDGDMKIACRGDLATNARIQNITADLGNVNIKANDDVRLNGERVFVNCVD